MPGRAACGSGPSTISIPTASRANTRGNAHGVDLNRNFAWRWRPRTAPGTTYYAGTGPLSEPESRFARRVILRVRPDITIWFHQSETAVDNSSGSKPIEARFARRVALPLRRLIRYPGSATTWQAHRFPKATAFVVELPPGVLTARATRAYARAVLALARARKLRPDTMLASKQVLGNRCPRRRRSSRKPSSGCALRSA